MTVRPIQNTAKFRRKWGGRGSETRGSSRSESLIQLPDVRLDLDFLRGCRLYQLLISKTLVPSLLIIRYIQAPYVQFDRRNSIEYEMFSNPSFL